MASITVNELHTTGVELFQDSESYLTELNNLDAVHGGTDPAANSEYNGVTATVFSLIEKGYEFGIYTLGIDAIAAIIKSFSQPAAK
ncbi:hypothetical protein [Fortiea contorta]|uniref:hypothetical protein n=1 Tax=Fortiea contorta TaxID=1892405 RepID=UPI00034A559D|nr:hypothetical protein [Fortiea contorta]